MNTRLIPCLVLLSCASLNAWAQTQPQASATPIVLHVDLTDAPRRLIHAHLEIPVTAGPLTLRYPEWNPGEHRPTGAIDNLAGLFFRADGKDLSWRRDSVDMFALHIDIPSGVTRLDASLDFLATPGATGSDMDGATSVSMTMLEWNALILYPAPNPVGQIPITASLTMPPGWKFGTALTIASQSGTEVSFAPVSIEQLVDSPILTGKYFREIPLAPEMTPKHFLDVAGDSPEDIEVKPEILASLNQLIREATTLFQSHHYDTYHFLLSFSDVLRGEGLEHAQSSDNGIEKKGFSDAKLALLNAELLPHEFTHSWNGKYRRPAGLATPDYATPMQGDLLWVYEGMTQYWGNVLAARTALWSPENYRGQLALSAAKLDVLPGRTWRNLEDTAISSQSLRGGSRYWSNWRRSQDYYREGELVWLDADTTIRTLTNDKKSLNDFCLRFLAVGGNTPPKVLPYTFDEIVSDLNEVVPYDWRGFLTQRLQSHAAHAPLAGIDHGGYRLVYAGEPTPYEQAELDDIKQMDAWFSVGLMVDTMGMIEDVRMGSIAFQAGLGPGTKLVAINGHGFTVDVVRQAIRDANGNSNPIDLIVSTDNEFRSVQLEYHQGEKYPRLERVEGTKDLIDEIIRPLAPSKGSGL